MKKFFQPLMLIATAAASLTACTKTNPIAETQMPNAVMAQEQSQLNGGTINPNFGLRLVKKGGDSLVYNADGSLAKVMVSPTNYITYQEAGNTLTATHYLQNAFNGKVEYKLDGNGRAMEAKYIGFSANGGGTPTYVYEYDANGFISKRYYKDHPLQRAEYSWKFNPSRLSRVTIYNAANEKMVDANFLHLDETDKLHLWPKSSALDSYLKIFGKKNDRMIGSALIQYPASGPADQGQVMVYDYNRDGYPVKQTITEPGKPTTINNYSYVSPF